MGAAGGKQLLPNLLGKLELPELPPEVASVLGPDKLLQLDPWKPPAEIPPEQRKEWESQEEQHLMAVVVCSLGSRPLMTMVLLCSSEWGGQGGRRILEAAQNNQGIRAETMMW